MQRLTRSRLWIGVTPLEIEALSYAYRCTFAISLVYDKYIYFTVEPCKFVIASAFISVSSSVDPSLSLRSLPISLYI